MASEAHDSALRRLDAELVEQDRLSERYDAAIGTSTELAAYFRLRNAGDQVAARESWLNWVDDEGYRGLTRGALRTVRRELQTMKAEDPSRAAQAAARQRGALHRAGGDRRVGRGRVGRAIEAQRTFATADRAWQRRPRGPRQGLCERVRRSR